MFVAALRAEDDAVTLIRSLRSLIDGRLPLGWRLPPSASLPVEHKEGKGVERGGRAVGSGPPPLRSRARAAVRCELTGERGGRGRAAPAGRRAGCRRHRTPPTLWGTSRSA